MTAPPRIDEWAQDPAAVIDSVLRAVLRMAAHPTAAAVAIAGGSVVVLAAVGVVRRRAGRHLRTGRFVEVLPPATVDPKGASMLWEHLHDLLRPRWRRILRGQPHLSFEYRWSETGLRIGIWVPTAVPPGLVERAVEAAWPGAQARGAEGPAVSADDAKAIGGMFRLGNAAWFPLRVEFDSDPLRPLIAAAAAAGDVTAQVLARPVSHAARARLHRAARELRTGTRSPTVLDLGTTRPHRRSADPAASAAVRDVLDKASSSLWSVEVRYLVASRDGEPRRALRGRAHAVAAAFAVFAGRNRLVRRRLRRPAVAIESRAFRRGDLLSATELAVLAHLPFDETVPGLARAGARAVAPPPAVTRDPSAGKVLGDSDAGPRRPVVLRPADGRYHLHVMGSTGSGKSTLLTRLILDDVHAGRGVVVVDPKGDLVTDVLARLRPAQRRHVVLLDPQADRQPTLNMLEVPAGVTPHVVVDHLVGIFSRVFESSWGPRLEDVLRSACLTLLQRPGATLSDVPRLLSADGDWRRYLDDRDAPEELRGFWGWYDNLGDAQRAQVTGPLLYKLRAFLLRPFARQVVDAPRSSIDMGELLDGGLLMARLPKGLVGEDTSRLLGSFVVAKTWQAATARASRPEAERRDASLVVDECQNYLTLPRSFDEILAEARGYRLSMVLAHQHLGQLPRDLRDAVSANARNKVLFSMSPEDAFVLQRHTRPQLGEHDLANLAAYQAAVRLTVGGEDQPAFTCRTRPVEPVAA